MITNTNTQRVFDHLNLFSVDHYKQQQQQQQHQQQRQRQEQDESNEFEMNLTSARHDKNLQTIIKQERDHHVDSSLNSSNRCADNFDQPLVIILDEDDVNIDEENESVISPIKEEEEEETKILSNEKFQSSVRKSQCSSSIHSKSRSSHRTKKARVFSAYHTGQQQTSNKLIRTVVIDTNFMQEPSSRTKLLARRKISRSSGNMSTNSPAKPLAVDENNSTSSSDSILSKISFDNHCDILTVSRMGSIFYCLEDLYIKVFVSLCTLEELTTLLSRIDSILIKQVTLSEKMSIQQQLPLLKKYSENRYRLISINFSELLLKLKQLLFTVGKLDDNEKQPREKRIEQIVDEMRSYKRTPTLVLLKDKVSHSPMSTKRLSTDDDDDEEEPRERLKIVTKKPKSNDNPSLAPTQFGIFIQCNGPVSCNIFSTNETVSTTTTTTTTTTNNGENPASDKTPTENFSKEGSLKKSTDSTQMYFDQFQHQYQTLPKFNLPSERIPVYKRTDSQSPTDCCQIKKSSSSNMPIKRRILSLYNNDTNDSFSPLSEMRSSITPTNQSRSLYRSKSSGLLLQPGTKAVAPLRSSSLPAIDFQLQTHPTSSHCVSKELASKINPKSKTEPIDAVDGSFSMPMIVNVEENVEFNNHRHKMKTSPSKNAPIPNLETCPSSASPARSPVLTKPIPTHHPPPPPSSSTSSSSPFSSFSSSYRPPSYSAYHQDPYTYRDSSQNFPQSYAHSAKSNTNGIPYPYPYSSSSGQYPIMKKSKDSPVPSPYDTRTHSVPPSRPASTNHNPHPPSTVVMPIVRKPNYYHQLALEQQAPIKMQSSPPTNTPCRLPCCYPSSALQQQHAGEKLTGNERAIYRQYSTPTPVPQAFKRDPLSTPELPTSSPTMNRKLRRMDLVSPIPPSTLMNPAYSPYPSTKSYFVPPPPPTSSSSSLAVSQWPSPSSSPSNPNLKSSVRYPYPPPPSTPVNGMTRKIEPYSQPRRPIPIPSRAPPPPSSTPVFVQNSSTLISPPNTPHELTLPNIRTRSVDLQRAIVERGYCDMDKLPKLVVRHTKTYSNRTVDTMGQLFPTWFNEPDYRCIHCFRCDQVFTPQQFMTHVDDELSLAEQPISMTSIQLLPSEKMSEYKVGLWNQFCTNLTIYAREGRIGGFSTSRTV